MNETKNQNPQDLMTEDSAADHMINRAELMANDIPGAEGPNVLAAVMGSLRDSGPDTFETHSIESAGRLATFHEINDSEIRIVVHSLTYRPEGVKVLSSRVFTKEVARGIWKAMRGLTASTATKGLRMEVARNS
jgi:hypothetical protein